MKTESTVVIGTVLLLTVGSINLSHAAGPFEEIEREEANAADVYAYFSTIEGTTEFGSTKVSDEGFVGGVGFGGNLNNYLNINMELGGGVLDTTYTDSSIENDTSVFEWRVGLDYNILKRRITPMITGDLGLMRQSVEATGFKEWTGTYGVGAGLRYDITDRICLKAAYQMEWTNFDGSSSSTRYDGFMVSLGWKF